jgi:hypothetical protein
MIEFVSRYQKLLIGVVLSIATFVFAVSTVPSSQAINPASSPLDMQFVTNQISLITYQQQAESVLLAKQEVIVAQSIELKRFAAIMTGDGVYPNPASTQASGVVGAALNGNRLIVRGGFRDLSSPLRDYASDPVNPPNPNITSAVHIHKGTSAQNGPFQYALQVQLDRDRLGGTVKGEYTLTDEQLQALMSGGLYVDLHTKGFRGGEIRGILKA